MAEVSFQGYCEVLCLAVKREEARRDKNYAEGDRLRDELARMGAECQDKTHTFTFREATGRYDLHHGLGPQEVQFVALEREEARRHKDYSRSDYLRDWLSEKGCTLDDKTHMLTAPDGVVMSFDLYNWQQPVQANGPRRGGCESYPHAHSRMALPQSYAQPAAPQHHPRAAAQHEYPPYREPYPQYAPSQPARMDAHRAYPQHPAPQTSRMATYPQPYPARETFPRYEAATRRAPPAEAPPPPQGSGDGFTGFHEVLCIALEREEMRRAKNYGESDRLRNELSSLGAECTDKTHSFMWKSCSGTYDLNVGRTAQDLQFIALEREEARRDKDYARSDELRDWLANEGVKVDDRSHTFTTESGITGSFDLREWQPMADSNFSASPRSLPPHGPPARGPPPSARPAPAAKRPRFG